MVFACWCLVLMLFEYRVSCWLVSWMSCSLCAPSVGKSAGLLFENWLRNLHFETHTQTLSNIHTYTHTQSHNHRRNSEQTPLLNHLPCISSVNCGMWYWEHPTHRVMGQCNYTIIDLWWLSHHCSEISNQFEMHFVESLSSIRLQMDHLGMIVIVIIPRWSRIQPNPFECHTNSGTCSAAWYSLR